MKLHQTSSRLTLQFLWTNSLPVMVYKLIDFYGEELLFILFRVAPVGILRMTSKVPIPRKILGEVLLDLPGSFWY